MEDKKYNWKVTAIVFIVFFVIVGFIALVNNSSSKNWENSYNVCQDNIQKNYIFKPCQEGYTIQCVQNGHQIYDYNPDTTTYPTTCNKGEYSAGCYNDKFQTSTICSKLDGYYANCNRIDSVNIKCPSNSWVGCQDTTGKWVASI